MTPSAPDRRIALIGGAESMRGIAERLARRGWSPIRVRAIRPEPVPVRAPPAWLDRVSPADLWIVTSRAVATTFLSVHPDWVRALRRIPEVAAVGPETARALRRLRVTNLRTVTRGGSSALLARLGPVAGRRVVYLRSDRAGPELARTLRARGARVLDRIVYRTRGGSKLAPRHRERVGAIPVWVVSSPSALMGFRTMIGAGVFHRHRGSVHAFGIGARTARALRESGVRHVQAPNESTEEGFTKLLEKALGDAPGRRSALHR